MCVNWVGVEGLGSCPIVMDRLWVWLDSVGVVFVFVSFKSGLDALLCVCVCMCHIVGVKVGVAHLGS